MAWSNRQRTPGRRVWQLVRAQHGVVSRDQLRALGYGRQAIEHRLARGRLHIVHRNVYAIGRPQLTQNGYWMAAVLACGRTAVLSHLSAAALWGIVRSAGPHIEVSVAHDRGLRRSGIVIHRRANLTIGELDVQMGIPVTSPSCTLIDIAAQVNQRQLEAAVIEADKLGLVDAGALSSAVGRSPRRPGLGRLRTLLERYSYRLTDSELERMFLRLVEGAGLPAPETGRVVNGYKTDFYWPRLKLVVETDGLRYHRTPQQQTRDRQRDQTHAAAGLTTLRFTHWQLRYDSRQVERILCGVVRRLSA